ncbi:LppP/LprE family lipoprotein [Rhodococcus fascians]|uniref:LppP/LprE family lipoprotein n=1 Tax=Rhodococcoides fascians TaxID=1828 RepID=UPI00196033CA|nr:LppP/LprE family lipoprotein [Rhodococcus fascians]MBM7245921.1 LppP/LprE family lipoprotein [Rhodococcus fascians]MBY3811662.1 LppP/LprE family lipoprotein [Rhodococcus fascians]MBY3843286.1 LppP/LprE family lipoprotein [Rhodococcus fascians]MBY3848519.1 LppP/LprE family lipoprotein [Rhodococcus fascians]MBY3852908.1 LppP/LprE family lipoprotein [Rhodococcus fascians]
MKRLLLLAVGATALVACGGSEQGTPSAAPSSAVPPTTQATTQTGPAPVTPDPATVTEGAQPQRTPPEEASDLVPMGPPVTGAQCLNLTSAPVTAAVDSLPPVFADSPWVATRIDDPCASFTWVEALPSGATVSSPTHLLFFHDAEYLGTATLEPYGFTSVAAQSSDTITVNYRWPLAGDANANPTGGPATIDYQWDGTQVTMIGTLPPEVTG